MSFTDIYEKQNYHQICTSHMSLVDINSSPVQNQSPGKICTPAWGVSLTNEMAYKFLSVIMNKFGRCVGDAI